MATPQPPTAPPRLVPFAPAHARPVASWVRTVAELDQLAPSTVPPLTAQKVIMWKKPGGRAWVLVHPVKREPLGYGELNPMRRRDRWWLGHILVQPALRGQGVGRLLVERLVDHAYTRLGATRVILVVSPDNTRALRCYQSVGFSVVGEERHAIANRGGSVRLARLELDPSARLTQRLPAPPPAAGGGTTARSKPRAATIT